MSKDFRFFDNRQKYLLFVTTTNEKNKIAEKISNTKCQGIIFSDFRHGIFNQMSIPLLIKAMSKKIYKVACPTIATFEKLKLFYLFYLKF